MSNRSQGIIRPSRWQIAILAVVAGSLALLFSLPGSASAATVNCKGKVTAGITDVTTDNAFTYQWTCSEPIVAYSIVTNRPTDYFTPENDVYIGNPKDGNVGTEAFQCEGPFPGNGFGCKGSSTPDATAPRYTVGGTAFQDDPCAKHAKGAGWKLWLTVTTLENDGVNKPFYIQSEPFRLGTSCKAAPGARHN